MDDDDFIDWSNPYDLVAGEDYDIEESPEVDPLEVELEILWRQ